MSKYSQVVVNHAPFNFSSKGEIAHTYGNYYLEIFPSADALTPSFRTYHLDADTNGMGIKSEQVEWYVV